MSDVLMGLARDVKQLTRQVERLGAQVSLSVWRVNVKDFGATGDDTTVDTAAILAAVAVLVALGRGELFFPPATYLVDDDIEIALISLTGTISITGYGACLHYTGNGKALSILTNCSGLIGSDCYQYGERRVTVAGLRFQGTSSAVAGLYLEGANNCAFRDLVFTGFTSVTAGSGAIKLYAPDLYHWVEEDQFDNIEIQDTGVGIVISAAAGGYSVSNNYFHNVNIWVTQASGKGIDTSITTNLTLGRCIFSGVIVHPFGVNNVICFDINSAYVKGSVFISPSVDVYGSPTGIVPWHYHGDEMLLIVQPIHWPDGFGWSGGIVYSGPGRYSVLGSGYGLLFSDGGHVTMVNAALPAAGTAVNSPVLAMFGMYEAAGTYYPLGMRLRVSVATDGTYHFSFRDTSDAEVAMITSGGYIWAAGGQDCGTGVFSANGTQVVTVRQAEVADAGGGTVVDVEARAAINALLSRLRAHGLIGLSTHVRTVINMTTALKATRRRTVGLVTACLS